MHGYVDPFQRPDGEPAERDDTEDSDVVDRPQDDDQDGGLDAVTEDQERGRREAPFSDDPSHRVRPPGD
jgi:hypothetical protein